MRVKMNKKKEGMQRGTYFFWVSLLNFTSWQMPFGVPTLILLIAIVAISSSRCKNAGLNPWHSLWALIPLGWIYLAYKPADLSRIEESITVAPSPTEALTEEKPKAIPQKEKRLETKKKNYDENISANKLKPIMSQIKKMISDGASSPRDLAEMIEKNKTFSRSWSNSIWSIFCISNASLEASPDWDAVYEDLDRQGEKYETEKAQKDEQLKTRVNSDKETSVEALPSTGEVLGQPTESKIENAEESEKIVNSKALTITGVVLVASLVGLFAFLGSSSKGGSSENKDENPQIKSKANKVFSNVEFISESDEQSDNVEQSSESATDQYKQAWSFVDGDGVAKSMITAVYWFEKAAKQGHANAQYDLARCFQNAKGVDEDLSSAAYWFEIAAKQGHAKAQCQMGVYYSDGKGVVQDDEKGIYWYRKSANQGNAKAQYSLGLHYYYGSGVQTNSFLAQEWFRKAYSQGYEKAGNYLK